MPLTKVKGKTLDAYDNNLGINIMDEGAWGDGSHDDTQGILNAVAKWSTYKLPIIVPSKTFLFNGLTISASNFRMVGLGNAVLKHTGSGPALKYDGSAGAIYRGSLENLTVQGNINTTYAYYFKASHHMVGDNLTARDCTNAFRMEWVVEGSWNNLRCTVNDGAFSTLTPTNGIYIGQTAPGYYSTNNTFINPTMEGLSGRGIYIFNGSNNTFLGGTSENNGIGVGISTAEDDCRRNAFHNLWCEANTQRDMDVYGDLNSFHGCYFGSTSPSGYNVNIITPATHNSFYDCYLRACDDQQTTTLSTYVNCVFPDNGAVGLIHPANAARIVNCRRVDNSAVYTTKYEDVLGTSGTVSNPEIRGATTAGTLTYGGTRSIVWHRIGNIVHCTLRIAITTIPVAPVGTLFITGLPFTSASDTQEIPFINMHNVTLPSSGYTYVAGVINASNTTITLETGGFGKALVGLDAATLTTSTQLYCQFSYRAI